MNGLPVIRLQRGYEAARRIAKRNKVALRVSDDIVRAAYEEVERQITRVGSQCEQCGALVANGAACPTHGPLYDSRLGLGARGPLLIAFDPVTWDAP